MPLVTLSGYDAGMRPNVHIGEASAQLDGVTFMFRPTLANIAEIGSPTEIVETFALVMSEASTPEHQWQQIGAAMRVLYHCADDLTPDLERLLGQWVDPTPRRYTPGRMPVHAIVALARQMMRHGVVGVPLDQPAGKPLTNKNDYSDQFKAAEYVAIATAHLGVSIGDAWQMTMTSLVQILAAKFPPDKRATVTEKDLERNDQAVAWLERVNAARKKGAANG